MAFALFILKCCFFFLLGGSACYALFQKVFEKRIKLNIIINIGLGPVFATLLLYYLLILLPGFSSIFYLSIIVLIWLFILIWKKKQALSFFINLLAFRHDFLNLFSFRKGLKHYLFATNNLAFVILFLVFVFGVYQCLMTGVIGHDALEYMVQGKYFFEQKEILYQANNYHPSNGFYYVGLHGWSFPLQVTLEHLFDDLTFAGYDLYFRLLTPLYGILILALTYYFVKLKTSIEYGVAAIALLVFAKGFFIGISYVHIDAYRIFLISLAFMCLVNLIKFDRIINLILLSFVAGNAAFTHSLNVFIAFFIGLALVLFIQRNLLGKIKAGIVFTGLLLLFGGLHYVLDIIWGTGWIFGNLDYY